MPLFRWPLESGAMDRAITSKPEFSFPPHVYATKVDGQMVLLNLESEEYFGLDAVGANIVSRLTKQASDDALLDLVNDYQVDAEVLRRDIRVLVEKLMAAGLLKKLEPPD